MGGITTWAHQIIKGFRNNGFEANHYYATRTGTFKCSETESIPIGNKYKRGEKIPSKSIGFVGEARIAEFRKLCDSYDYVIFIHPSPHPTKGNLAAKGMEDWRRLYSECPIPKVVIFHDKKWDRTNPWFKDVVDHVDVVLAAQHNFIDSVNTYANLSTKKPILTDWLFFPIDMEHVGTARVKEPRLVSAPQWIKWKNHDKLLEVADQIKLPIHLYNGGMQGQQQLNQMGFQGSNELAQSLANLLMSQSNLAYQGQNAQNTNDYMRNRNDNDNKKNGMKDIFSSLSSLIPMIAQIAPMVL